MSDGVEPGPALNAMARGGDGGQFAQQFRSGLGPLG